IDLQDRVLLIVEDDPHYAHILLDLARAQGFKGVVAMRGAEALNLAKQFNVAAVTLDIFLPDTTGWTILSHLKQNPETRHIPVHIVTVDEERLHGLTRGAFAYLNKSASSERIGEALQNLFAFTSPRSRRLLIIENPDDKNHDMVDL